MKCVISHDNKYLISRLLLLSSTCLHFLRRIVGRRLKGTGLTRNEEEEQPTAAWGPGDGRERFGMKDVILEPRSAAARAQGGED